MANQQGHMTFSACVSVAYGAAGILLLHISPEHMLLGCAMVLFAGMLPNVDAGNEPPARELGALVAAVIPLVALEYYPALKSGGLARIALIVIFAYVITRVVIVRGLQKYATHRGMIHSIPAAIITFEATYLIFRHESLRVRLFIAFAAFVGFLCHLLLDAYGNMDLVGRAMGKPANKAKVLKLVGDSFKVTLVVYSCMLLLGWFVAKDLYPNLKTPQIVW